MLLDIFSDVKLSIPSSIVNFEKLRRYFVAYDGHLLKDHDQDEATHVIASENTKENKPSKKVLYVTEDWLWDCIKLQKLLPAKVYEPEYKSPKLKKTQKHIT